MYTDSVIETLYTTPEEVRQHHVHGVDNGMSINMQQRCMLMMGGAVS